MADSISPISAFPNVSPVGRLEAEFPIAGGSAESSSPASFQDLLLRTIDQVASSDEQAQKMIEEGLAGGDINQAEIFIAMKKTDLAYRTLIQIRNQAIDAYNEIQQMRM